MTVSDNKSRLDRHSEQIKALQQDRKLLADIDKKLSDEFFENIQDIREMLEGNGKPGFKAIRDKVLSWENKFNALGLAVIIDIIVRVVSSVYR